MGWHWSVSLGWCVARVLRANADGRATIKVGNDKVKVNYVLLYEHDEHEAKHSLRLCDYGDRGDIHENGGWVLLEKSA